MQPPFDTRLMMILARHHDNGAAVSKEEAARRAWSQMRKQESPAKGFWRRVREWVTPGATDVAPTAPGKDGSHPAE